MDAIFERLLIELLAIAAQIALVRLVAWVRSLLAARADANPAAPSGTVLAQAA